MHCCCLLISVNVGWEAERSIGQSSIHSGELLLLFDGKYEIVMKRMTGILSWVIVIAIVCSLWWISHEELTRASFKLVFINVGLCWCSATRINLSRGKWQALYHQTQNFCWSSFLSVILHDQSEGPFITFNCFCCCSVIGVNNRSTLSLCLPYKSEQEPSEGVFIIEGWYCWHCWWPITPVNCAWPPVDWLFRTFNTSEKVCSSCVLKGMNMTWGTCFSLQRQPLNNRRPRYTRFTFQVRQVHTKVETFRYHGPSGKYLFCVCLVHNWSSRHKQHCL